MFSPGAGLDAACLGIDGSRNGFRWGGLRMCKALSVVSVPMAQRATSVNALVREYLDELIARESRQETARHELLALCRDSQAETGEAPWTRESLYDG